MRVRFLTLVGLCFAVLVLPWWATVFLLLISLVYFSWFYEAILPAVLFDLLYSLPQTAFFGFYLISVIIVLLTIFLVEEIRKRLFVYRDKNI